MGMRPESFHILIVDDFLPILEILSEFLGRNGYQVTSTHDGRKALELIETKTFDLVLTDLQMPIVDGWKVTEKAKMKKPPIPVILLTGSIDQYAEGEISNHPVDELLTKPLNLNEILNAIKRHLPASPKTAGGKTEHE